MTFTCIDVWSLVLRISQVDQDVLFNFNVAVVGSSIFLVMPCLID